MQLFSNRLHALFHLNFQKKFNLLRSIFASITIAFQQQAGDSNIFLPDDF